jgi:hypothetical protein
VELENHSLLHFELVLVRGEETKVDEFKRKISTGERDKEHQTVSLERQWELDNLNVIVLDYLPGDSRTNSSGVRCCVFSPVEGIVGEESLMIW